MRSLTACEYDGSHGGAAEVLGPAVGTVWVMAASVSLESVTRLRVLGHKREHSAALLAQSSTTLWLL